LKKAKHKVRNIGLVANSEKAACALVVGRAAQLIRRAGRKVYADTRTAQMAGLANCEVCEDLAQLSRKIDLLLVFGGDGTILRVARQIAGSQTPILGVNTGSLGFLTAIQAVELAGALRKVWAGEFAFESRVLIEAVGSMAGKPVRQQALNDLVISRGSASRLIELEVKIDGEALTSYRCDGLIVSSPTGSTAYSLAAGGAVVFPTARVLELTPICPHTLSNRSLIIPNESTIQVKVVTEKLETILSADGQVVTELQSGDVLTIRRAKRAVRLMHLEGSSFCETLRRKLHWRGANF
jgi:NAD+ kinase